MPSIKTKFLQPIVVNAEEMREFVEDGDTYFGHEFMFVGKVLFEGFLVDVNDIGRHQRIPAVSLGERYATIEAIHRIVGAKVGVLKVGQARAAFHNDVNVLQVIAKGLRDVR